MNSVVQEWSRLIALVSLILKAWGSSFAVYCVCWCSHSGFFFSFGYFVVSICGLIFSRRSLWDSLGSAWEYCSEERFYIYLWLVLRDTSVLRLLMLVSCPEDPRLTGNVDLISKPKWRSATNYESSGRVLLFPFFFFSHPELTRRWASLRSCCAGVGGGWEVENVVSSSSFQCSPGKFLASHGVLSSHSTLRYFWVQDETLNSLWPLKSSLLGLLPSSRRAARAPADACHSVSTFSVASGHMLFSLWAQPRL